MDIYLRVEGLERCHKWYVIKDGCNNMVENIFMSPEPSTMCNSAWAVFDSTIYRLGGNSARPPVWPDVHLVPVRTKKSNEVYCFDTCHPEDSWKKAPSMFYERDKAYALVAGNGKMYVLGGDHRNKFNAWAEVYDPTSDDGWKSVPERANHHASAAHNEEMSMLGGTLPGEMWEVKIYDSSRPNDEGKGILMKFGRVNQVLGAGEVKNQDLETCGGSPLCKPPGKLFALAAACNSLTCGGSPYYELPKDADDFVMPPEPVGLAVISRVGGGNDDDDGEGLEIVVHSREESSLFSYDTVSGSCRTFCEFFDWGEVRASAFVDGILYLICDDQLNTIYAYDVSSPDLAPKSVTGLEWFNEDPYAPADDWDDPYIHMLALGDGKLALIWALKLYSPRVLVYCYKFQMMKESCVGGIGFRALLIGFSSYWLPCHKIDTCLAVSPGYVDLDCRSGKRSRTASSNHHQ